MAADASALLSPQLSCKHPRVLAVIDFLLADVVSDPALQKSLNLFAAVRFGAVGAVGLKADQD